jgi:hypothetical protein
MLTNPSTAQIWKEKIKDHPSWFDSQGGGVFPFSFS